MTGSPIGKAHPSPVFFAGIGLPMGRPAPSSAVIAHRAGAFQIAQRDGPGHRLDQAGDSPPCVRVRVSFHFMLVLATREPAVSSIFSERAMGFESSEESTMAGETVGDGGAQIRHGFGIGRNEPDERLRAGGIDGDQPVSSRAGIPGELLGIGDDRIAGIRSPREAFRGRAVQRLDADGVLQAASDSGKPGVK